MRTHILTLVIAILFSLLLAETILRLVGFYRPPVSVADPILGNFRMPNVRFIYTQEGVADVSINSVGLRDREHSLEKPDNTYRIAVLGDSYAEAYQVNLNETFWAILEEQLNQCRNFAKRVEVINFGVSGYGTAQELLMLRHRVWDFDPDMVLLAFLTGNDIRNNSKSLEPEKARPFFHLNDQGGLVLDDSFRDDPRFVAATGVTARIRNLIDPLRIVQLLSVVKQRISSPSNKSGGVGDRASRGGELGLDDDIYLKEPGPDWREAWKITEALLGQLNREVSARTRAFLVVTLSNGIQVHPRFEITDEFLRSLQVNDIFEPDRKVTEFGERHGFSVLSLAPQMQAIARDRKIYLHGFDSGNTLGAGHWNQNGHRVAADLISAYLCNHKQNAR